MSVLLKMADSLWLRKGRHKETSHMPRVMPRAPPCAQGPRWPSHKITQIWDIKNIICLLVCRTVLEETPNMLVVKGTPEGKNKKKAEPLSGPSSCSSSRKQLEAPRSATFTLGRPEDSFVRRFSACLENEQRASWTPVCSSGIHVQHLSLLRNHPAPVTEWSSSHSRSAHHKRGPRRLPCASVFGHPQPRS